MSRLYQGSFNQGEFAPGLWGRVDLDRYQSALRICRNMLPLPEGGVVKRPGLEFVGFGVESVTADMRLIPFKFNNEQTYIVVAQPNAVWFIRDGGAVLEAMDAQGGAGTPTVGNDGINGLYCDYTTHGYVAGDIIYWMLGGFDEIRGRWMRVSSSGLTANRFYLEELVTADSIDASAYSTNATTIDFGKVYSLTSADGWYSGVSVDELDFTQANDTLYVSHPDAPTKVITRTGHTAWTIASFNPAPSVSAPVLEATPLEVGTEPTAMVSSVSQTYCDHPSGAYTPGDIYYLSSGGFVELQGKWLRVASSPSVTATRFYVLDHETGAHIDSSAYTSDGAPVLTRPATFPAAGTPPVKHSYAITAIDKVTFEESLATILDIVNSDEPAPGDEVTLFWDDQATAKTYRIYKSVGGIYGLIGSVEDPDPDNTGDALTFEDNGITPNLSIAPPLEADYFGEAGDYPGAVELFQQRIWFGRTDDLLRDIYASRSGSLSSFATSTVNTDDDPIVQTIAARSVQEVRYFVPLRDLVVMTSDAEWGFDTGQDGVLTPGSGLVAQSWWGSARVKPALVGDSAIFVERSNRSVRDLAFSLQNDGFASSEISIFAKHLFAGRRVVSLCFSENPYQVLFCVMSDGRAVSCTYVRDQQIFAWARHETNGFMLDCAAVYEDGIDNVYVAVERSLAGDAATDSRYRQVERMRMVVPQFLDQGVYLDNSVDFRPGNGSTVTRPRIVDGELELHLPDTIANNTIIRLRDTEGTLLESLNGVSLMVDKTDVVSQVGGSANRDWYRVYRHNNGDVATRQLFRWEDYLPDKFRSLVTAGNYEVASSSIDGMHHLAYRGSNVAIRGDRSMATSQSVDDGGIVALGTAKSVVVFGETYTSEIETLDIDNVQDPITGLPLNIGDFQIRFGMAHGFMLGRTRSQMRTLTDLSARDDFNFQLGALQGVVSEMVRPSWKRQGRMVVRSVDGFPFSILAVIPNVQAGDLDV